MVAKGKDCADLFPAVVKNVVSKNSEVREMLSSLRPATVSLVEGCSVFRVRGGSYSHISISEVVHLCLNMQWDWHMGQV
jgi:hypothetical protein